MKKVILLLISVLIITNSLIGCVGFQSSEDIGESTQAGKNSKIIVQTVSWTGEFGEESLKAAISSYGEKYSAVDLSMDNKNDDFKIQIGTDISSYSVSRISCVGDSIDHELETYIDLSIDTVYEETSGYLSIDLLWWYGNDSWVNDYPVWSYLIYTKSTSGTETYYYFRVNYNR